MSELGKVNQLKIGFISLFFIVGLVLSAGVVSGDELGRVNLLHFIALFVLWPFVSCILLIVSKVLPKAPSVKLLPLLLKLPIIPASQKSALTQLKREQRFAPWLMMCSQQSVLAFSLGCLVSFLMVLLFSDVAFVWRSTLLSASHIEPVLRFIALPWQFFDAALPNIALIEATQENRFTQTNAASNTDFGAWWLYLLTAQLMYAIVPRIISSAVATWRFNRLPSYQPTEAVIKAPVNPQPEQTPLAKVNYLRPDLKDYNLCCWLAMPPALLEKVKASYQTQPANVYQVGFHGNDEQVALDDKRPQILVVAAWEPPMGELKDYLTQSHGVIELIDHKEGELQPIASHYVDEWRRFCLTLDNWILFINKDFSDKELGHE
ncbi:MAG: DUF2868 domain-containing protein [Psychrobium sp.]